MKNINIAYKPADVQEGMVVTLTAAPPASAMISDCRWCVDGPGVSGGGDLSFETVVEDDSGDDVGQ